VTSRFLCWNWNASLLNSTWGYNFNWRNTGQQTACSNLSCTLVMEEGRQKSKRLSYTAKFICEVSRCAEDKGNCKAAAIFGVDESNVRLWRKHKAAISGRETSRKKFTGPSLHVLSWETQDWTVCELWSTVRGGDKEGQIFEHSSKSF